MINKILECLEFLHTIFCIGGEVIDPVVIKTLIPYSFFACFLGRAQLLVGLGLDLLNLVLISLLLRVVKLMALVLAHQADAANEALVVVAVEFGCLFGVGSARGYKVLDFERLFFTFKNCNQSKVFADLVR